MGGTMASFARPVSGMQAAQAGLYVTSHNISNVGTEGYVRQLTVQGDSTYLAVGRDGMNTTMALGLGTDVIQIRQIRDEFLDRIYRTQAGRTAFYAAKALTINELENVIGELEADSKMSAVLNNLSRALQELSVDPSSIAARESFIMYCRSFVTKANDMSKKFLDYQYNLDSQVRDAVDRINELVAKIDEMNKLISSNEISGDNANDYRDIRNSALDELSTLIDIDYKVDAKGCVNISTGGNDLLANGAINKIGLRYVGSYGFVEPVFTRSESILQASDNAIKLFPSLYTKATNSNNNNDYGELKALLLARGENPANYATSEKAVENTVIPKYQRQLDILVNTVVTLINDIFSPPGNYDYNPSTGEYTYYGTSVTVPVGLDGSSFTEIFSRKDISRYYMTNAGPPEEWKYYGEDPNDVKTLYTMGNLVINPDIINGNCWNKMPLSPSGDYSDNTFIEAVISAWRGAQCQATESSPVLGFNEYYRNVITDLGNEGDTAYRRAESEAGEANLTDNKRKNISDVSLDEELTYMMKFQHAYNASARMLNVIDSMLDKVINGTGRVGR